MAFGQFMALIDIQIVAASLNEIQAGLSAAPEEISWIQTGYLIAELVMIPFSAFLSQALSTRWLFVASAGLFTAASALCGMAWDIESMILFRVIQGFVGGAMVPLVFATGFVMFSGPQRAMIPAILGMVSVLAPTLGPTVGGWLTDAVGWRSIFYINIVPGHCDHGARGDADQSRSAESADAEAHRLHALRIDGAVPRRAAIRARGGPAARMVQ